MNLDTLFVDLHKMQTRVYTLAAIWYERPVQTSTERTCRITEGHEVCVKDGRLIDCSEENKANYKVTGCKGALNDSTLHLVLTRISDNEPLTLKIK